MAKSNSNLKHPWLKLALLVVSSLIVAALAYSLRLYSETKYAHHKAFVGTDTVTDPDIRTNKPFAVLLLGTDTGAFGRDYRGRTDTIIVAVVNPKKKTSQLVSIPRDTLAEMPSSSDKPMQKINAAFAFDGEKGARESVSKLLNIPIKYSLTVNMAGLQGLVDAVGGIDVNVGFSWSDPKVGPYKFKKGPMHLDGKMALAYARMRHEDPKGDYGRQQRQQEVIQAVVKKALSFDGLQRFTEILNTLSDNMQTNLNFDTLTYLATNYRPALDRLSTDTLKGHDAWLNNASYEIPSQQEIQRVSDKLRDTLGLEEEAVENANTRQNAANTNFNWDNPAAQTFYLYD